MLKQANRIWLWIVLALIALPLTSYASNGVAENENAIMDTAVVDSQSQLEQASPADDDDDGEDGEDDDDDGEEGDDDDDGEDGDDDDDGEEGEDDDDDGEEGEDDDDGEEGEDDDDGEEGEDDDDDGEEGEDDDDEGEEGEDDDDDDDEDEDENEVYGFVESFPAQLIGNWMVGGATYVANADTMFEQEDGAFAVGACVEIEHLANSNVAIEIKTEHVSECHGMERTVGQLEQYDPNNPQGNWVISGVTYEADPAIQVGAGSQAPTTGELVFTSSYETNRTPYLMSVARAHQLFLPAVVR